jgi:ABC-2 type transport system permease protein
VKPRPTTQFMRLARRLVARTLRQPVIIVPAFAFPLFILAVVSSGGSDVTDIEGFPTDSYVTFLLGSMLVQGSSGAATVAGNALGGDIATGFLRRLVLTPLTVSTLLGAQLSGVALLGLVQAVIYLLVGLAAGVSVETGVAGAMVLLGVTLLTILAFGAVGQLTAVLTGSAEQVQALVALTLALLFMSSMMMPRDLIEQGWFETVATYNPMSYLIEAPRSLLISGWDGEALALGCGIAGGVFILAVVATSLALKRRFVRT